MTRKYFGTDGIRGTVGRGCITPEFMLKLGWALGRVFASHSERGKQSKFIIGKDTRISGYMFESALEAGLSAAGASVSLLGPMPTPAIAYLTRTFKAQAGIVISASHNPYPDNGVKFFSSQGSKLDDALELAIEAMLDEPMAVVSAEKLGKVIRVPDAAGRYIEFCKSTVPLGFDLTGMKIVIDCANGATYHVAPSVFSELGADVVSVACEPDGLNINEHCGSTKPKLLQRSVLEHDADLGIAFDGDGDRVIFVDQSGEVVDGDELLLIIARDYHKNNMLQGGVVGTVMSNMGLEVALKEREIPFIRAKVGDRYVMSELVNNQWLLGGESSGHLVCRRVTTTGDGIISALQVLVALVNSGKPLHEAKRYMTKYPQTTINVRVSQRSDPMQDEVIYQQVSQAEASLKGKGRVLLRMSGTEPVIRVMVEAEDSLLVESVAQELADLVAKRLAS